MNLTLKQLKIFLSIVNHNGMTDASEHLHMTKGAISQNLAELEYQLGVRLFDRYHTRLYLNQFGLKLVPLADDILSRVNSINYELGNNPTPSLIKIGCTKTIGSIILPKLLKDLEKKSEFTPVITIENNDLISNMLGRFEIDIALTEGPTTECNQESQIWMKDEMIVIASNNHKLSKKQASYNQLNEEHWILRESGSASVNFFHNQIGMKFKEPLVITSLNSIDSILNSVYNNLGLTFMSKAFLANPFYSKHLSQIKTEDRFFRNFNIAINKDKNLQPNTIKFIEFIKKEACNIIQE